MLKEEWSEKDERHRRQSCEGSSERVRATSEFQKDLRDRTKAFALRIVHMFSALPKTTEAQVLGKQLLRSGTSIGANYREAFRARSKAEFIAKCGDSLREIEESSYWLELLVESGVVEREKARTVTRGVRGTDRDFRYDPEASEDFLIFPSSFFLSFYFGQAARSFAAISLYSASGSFLLGAGVPGAFPPKEGMT